MAKFLLCSSQGCGAPVALTLKQQGHDVILWIEDKKYTRRYDHMVPKVEHYEDALDDERIVLMDMSGIGVPEKTHPQTEEAWASHTNLAEELRSDGFLVVGGGVLNDRLEWDRTWGAEQAKQYGLVVPESIRFEDFDEAIAHVTAHKDRYIYKPHGNLGVTKNYLAREWDDMVAMLEYYAENPKNKGTVFELQAFIDGQQMGTELWWDGRKASGISGTFEFKPQLHGDLGPQTGETGSVIFYYPEGKRTKIHRDIVDKIVPMLRDLKYPPGPIDINTLINEDGAHFLEFSPRFGYPATVIQLSSVTDDWGEVFEQVAYGTFEGFHPTPQPWKAGVLIVIPQWPYDQCPDFKDAPMFQRWTTEEHRAQIHVTDIYQDDKGTYRCAGTDGELMCATATGDSILEAEAKMYRLAREVYLHNMGWRDDVGEGIRLKDLERWNFWLPHNG